MPQSQARKRRQRAHRFDRTRWVEQLDEIILNKQFQNWMYFDPEILLTCGKGSLSGVRCGRTLAVGGLHDDHGIAWGGNSLTGPAGRYGRQLFVGTPNHRRPRAPGAPYHPRPWSLCDLSHQDPEMCCDSRHEPQRIWHCHPTKCGAGYTTNWIAELEAVVKLLRAAGPDAISGAGPARRAGHGRALELVLGVDLG